MSGLFQQPEWIELPGARLCLWQDYIPEQQQFYKKLLNEIGWQQLHSRVYGKTTPLPRLVAYYGDADYAYSGLVHPAGDWPPELFQLKNRLEKDLKAPFNSVLLNYYRSGMDSMGYHSDDETVLGEQPVLASVSLGVTRRFSIRLKEGGQARHFELEGGTLLVMAGDMQHCWQHALPVQRRVSEGRINLTFRQIYPAHSVEKAQ